MELVTKSGRVTLPAFFPDGTNGAVRGTDSVDVLGAGIQGMVVNTYHLMRLGLLDVVSAFGGLHAFMHWKGPLITDSGGFQVLSLIRKDKKFGSIDDEKVVFRHDGGRVVLTPERCVQIQLQLGSDIVMCLDDCTHADDPLIVQERSVARTIKWAQRCKNEFVRLTADLPDEKRPLLFGIVQGGMDKKLREECARALIAIGFDGYAYGGWPVAEGVLLEDILHLVCSLLPSDKPRYAMGVGKPDDIIKCVQMGYTLFDCVIPTREARHTRVYTWEKDPALGVYLGSVGFVELSKGVFKMDQGPLSPHCSCYTCARYSRAYLRNLFKCQDALAIRLATIHNLAVYGRLMQELQKQSDNKE